MTFEELKAIANAKAEKAKPRHEESQIQRSCLRWFRLQYPQYALLCFAVPNGGARNKREASIMKAEGVTAGVADVILLIPSSGFALFGVQDTDGQTAGHAKGMAEGSGNGRKQIHRYTQL